MPETLPRRSDPALVLMVTRIVESVAPRTRQPGSATVEPAVAVTVPEVATVVAARADGAALAHAATAVAMIANAKQEHRSAPNRDGKGPPDRSWAENGMFRDAF